MFPRLARRLYRYRSAGALAAVLSTSAAAAWAYHSYDGRHYTAYASSSTALQSSPARAPLQTAPVPVTPPASTPASPSLLFAPSREESLQALKQPDAVFDVLVIGGGATGSGIALDCALRGLSVGLVEASDFSSGASSRSTKLIHGGIRYLQKAFMQLDRHQYTMVQEALAERHHLLNSAPHLAHSFPIIVPIYTSFPAILFYAPYYWIGCKLYDTVAGSSALLQPSYYLTRQAALAKFPTLKPDGLWGGMVYYDGQHNDSRMNLAVALTAAAHGARIVNHTRVLRLLRAPAADGLGRVTGARVRDELTGDEWDVRAREVVNATGPLTDSIRQMADPSTPSCITPSAGIHVVLPPSYCPPDMGLIVPETSDGRVLFLLPWEGSTIVGTTDYLSPVTPLPRPSEGDVDFVLREVSHLLKEPVKREDVRSVWSGIRPLAKDVKARDTQSVNRDHIVEHTAPGLTTITGGKWTTYRKMAEDTVNSVLAGQRQLAQQAGVKAEWLIDTSRVRPCSTWSFPLLGTAGYRPELTDELTAKAAHLLPPSPSPATSPAAIIRHLTHNYGDRAQLVLDVARAASDFSLLSPSYPFLTAEVVYACDYEYAHKAVDVLAHRTRLCFLDTKAAEEAVGKVVAVMGRRYGWDAARRRREVQEAQRFFETMKTSPTAVHVPINTADDTQQHTPGMAAIA